MLAVPSGASCTTVGMTRKLSATLDIRISPRQREALDWWADASGWSVAEVARRFLSVPHPDEFAEPRAVWDHEDVWEELRVMREVADQELEERIAEAQELQR